MLVGACADPARRPLGATCGDSTECVSGLCMDGVCVDPAEDLDGDGLINSLEAMLGSNASAVDSDGDSVLDPDELGPGLALIDTDGDGKPDIVESAIADADQDCITDQYDRDDATPSTDLTPMVAAVCPLLGICGADAARLRAECPDGAHALCVFREVVGYANPELACDGRDENCDGRVDEGFPGGCAAPLGPFFSSQSAARSLATGRFRATLVVGQPALGDVRSDRYRAVVGADPVLVPPSAPEAP